jgi:NAD+ synthase (glutamine-hydrolysing)
VSDTGHDSVLINIIFLREYIPVDPKELANRIFVTCYMGSENSSEDTRSRAKNLAQDVGSYHMGKISLMK